MATPRYGHAAVSLNLDEHYKQHSLFPRGYGSDVLLQISRNHCLASQRGAVSDIIAVHQHVHKSSLSPVRQTENSVLLVLAVVWIRLHMTRSLDRDLPQLNCVFF